MNEIIIHSKSLWISALQNSHSAPFLFCILHMHSSLDLRSISFQFNHLLYCQLLCLSLAAHTPDNSFMGFVAEELNETERLNIQRNKVNNMAVVYGKEASMWKVSIGQQPLQKLHFFFLSRVSNLWEEEIILEEWCFLKSVHDYHCRYSCQLIRYFGL